MKQIMDNVSVILTLIVAGIMFSFFAGLLPTLALKFIFPSSIFFYGTFALLTSTVIGAIVLIIFYTIHFKE